MLLKQLYILVLSTFLVKFLQMPMWILTVWFVIPLQRLVIPIQNMDFLLRRWEYTHLWWNNLLTSLKVLTKPWRFVEMLIKIHWT
ncbi:Uncharacterised protein [Mycobacterium tuberculosis]|nr:Uncharacterised protein [Mycobacterium tuberculosis]CKV15447.1 Uncharacterised protein [Mycobacterium tuberculosis]